MKQRWCDKGGVRVFWWKWMVVEVFVALVNGV